MEKLYEWVRQIAYVMVLISVIMQLAAGKQYQKYIRLYTGIVLILFILFYKELFYVTFDESSARLAGIRINSINFMFTILTAITVSVATRIVGTLVISSILVLPVACALQLKKGFRKTVLYSMLFGVVFHIIGLFLAYYVGIKPGGTIILVGVLWFVLIGFIKLLTKQVKRIHQKGDKK